MVGLVNNAGVSHRLPLELDNITRIRYLYDVNVFGLLQMSQAFTPLLRKSHGRIVNVGSVAALLPHKGSGAYGSSKAAVEHISDVQRLELSEWGVSVSLIEPAYVKTAIASKQTGENSPVKTVDLDRLQFYRQWADNFDAKRKTADLRE